jgi:DNA-binding IclR family transcriptional regulator
LVPAGADRVPRGIALVGFEHQMTERAVRQFKDQLREATQLLAAQLH